MAIDMRRVILAAVQAGLEEPAPKPKKKLLPARRALLIGAGMATIGRVALRTRGDGIVDAIQQRVAALGGDDYEDEEFDDEEADDEEFDDEEAPEGDADEDFDDEQVDDDEDLDDEGVEDDEDFDDDQEPEDEDLEDEDVAEDEQSSASRRS
jgi:hypothetical protein